MLVDAVNNRNQRVEAANTVQSALKQAQRNRAAHTIQRAWRVHHQTPTPASWWPSWPQLGCSA